jgi:hypothetical protein
MAKRQATIEFEAVEFPTAHEAIQHAEAAGGEAIRLDDKYLVLRQDDADRLTAAGVAFAWMCDHEGQIVTVPVND